MRKLPSSFWVLGALALALTGCATKHLNSAVTDVALTGAGGVLGHKLSNGRPEVAAAGALAGYLGSKAAQSAADAALREAEKAGYDRAMNQAVKQQYWIIQNQQKSLATEPERDARLVPVVIPESKINGVIIAAHVEYLRVTP